MVNESKLVQEIQEQVEESADEYMDMSALFYTPDPDNIDDKNNKNIREEDKMERTKTGKSIMSLDSDGGDGDAADTLIRTRTDESMTSIPEEKKDQKRADTKRTALYKWCEKYDVVNLHDTLVENGFKHPHILATSTFNELQSMGLKLGEIKTLLWAFKQEQQHENKTKNNDNNNNINDDNNNENKTQATGASRTADISAKPPDWKDEKNWKEIWVGSRKRKCYVGPKPDTFVKKYTRDLVTNLVLVESRDTDVKKIRHLVDNRLKSGVQQTIRYQYDEKTQTFPNPPVFLAYSAANKLQKHRLVIIEDQWYGKGSGGFTHWKGTLARNKVSDAWNTGTPHKRLQLHRFMKEHEGVKWQVYMMATDDIFNCQNLRLIDSDETPLYEYNLKEHAALHLLASGFGRKHKRKQDKQEN